MENDDRPAFPSYRQLRAVLEEIERHKRVKAERADIRDRALYHRVRHITSERKQVA